MKTKKQEFVKKPRGKVSYFTPQIIQFGSKVRKKQIITECKNIMEQTNSKTLQVSFILWK